MEYPRASEELKTKPNNKKKINHTCQTTTTNSADCLASSSSGLISNTSLKYPVFKLEIMETASEERQKMHHCSMCHFYRAWE